MFHGLDKGLWVKLWKTNNLSSGPQTRPHRDIQGVDVVQGQNAQGYWLKVT